MPRKTDQGFFLAHFHIFPGLILPNPIENLGQVEIKSKDQLIYEQPKNKAILEKIISLFQDPYGNNFEKCSYIVDQEVSIVEEVWSLLRYAAYEPREDYEIYRPRRNPDIVDWFLFYTSQHEKALEKPLEIFSIDKNGIEIWGPFYRTDMIKSIQRLHLSKESLIVHKAGLQTSQRLSVLFAQKSEYDLESIKLANRIRKAIYWYNKSYELYLFENHLRFTSIWDLETELLCMAIAFEILFQPSKSNIQKHLETSLKVIFPDNEFVPKWLNQFYAARSTIAHGSSVDRTDLEFKLDKSSHHNLIYWSRKIFWVSVEAIVSQWEIANRSGLLKVMTPNRIRLKRISGRINSLSEDILYKHIPEEIQVDLKDFHASWFDIPGEDLLVLTHDVGNIFARVAINSQNVNNLKLKNYFTELLDLPSDWYKVLEKRLEACNIYSNILELFGDDANITSPLAELVEASSIERSIYYWARFAYAHIWSIDI